MVKTDLTLKSLIKSKMLWMGFTYLEPMKQPKEDMSILSKSPGKYSSQFIHLGQMKSKPNQRWSDLAVCNPVQPSETQLNPTALTFKAN